MKSCGRTVLTIATSNKALNDSGQIAFLAFFTDGTQAIVERSHYAPWSPRLRIRIFGVALRIQTKVPLNASASAKRVTTAPWSALTRLLLPLLSAPGQ